MSVVSRKKEWKKNLIKFYRATGQAERLPLTWDFGERLLAQRLTRRLYWFKRYTNAMREGNANEALRCEQLAEQALSLDNQQNPS